MLSLPCKQLLFFVEGPIIYIAKTISYYLPWSIYLPNFNRSLKKLKTKTTSISLEGAPKK